MTQYVDAPTLKAWLHDGAEIALLDVREHGQYGESHLFLAVPLPYSRLELEVGRLVPRRAVRVVVYDHDESVAVPAAAALRAAGYTDVHVLRGGTAAWAAAGYALFAGVNVPSKTFGELVEHRLHTPRIGAEQLHAMQARGDKLVVLDGRPLSEYRKMNIPGAICCPNGELAYRLRDLVPDDDTPIVINCAGRTRSIIGAQTLINLGVPNPVYALENGTQGWYLADYQLEHGNDRHYPDKTEANTAELEPMRAAAARLAERHGVSTVDLATVQGWARDTTRTLFLCDVRTPEEFARGTLPGAQHTPGGQLIQATDQYVGVRGARLVLFDDDGVRAPVVASWLRQLGHDAHVLADGLRSGLALSPAPAAALPALPAVDAARLARGLDSGEVVAIDLRASMDYRKAHVPGARWSIRPRLAHDVAGEARPLVLIADQPDIAAAAALSLPAPQRALARVLDDGIAGWKAAGLPLAASPNEPADRDCIDYLFFVHDRHDGNKAAARQYLAWETNLISQLDDAELGSYRLP
ncbi:rhodanese-like domain-containing protein [Cupriavidus gilardii]|uniref:rhodanese-like domain-containing protein n=1 Tax=Cupriavidus gilardii TaxID=82541 RepID=UPI0021BEB225|nr:rhodanese-like domain-containing protein [Cupriavidus gilardii]MCT9123042.1 rhodanese-like domain-containing protein [Cupriavidus gilardii]